MPRGTENFTILKLATDLADRATVQRNPRKDLPNNLGLSLDNFVACLASPLVLPDVAIAVRRTAEDVDDPRLRRVPFSPAAPFKYLGTFIFCHHPLNLEQQIFLGRPADVMVEEDDLDAMPLQFLDQKHLIRVATGEAIRRVNIDPIEGASRGLVAEALQSRTQKCSTAVAFVDEAQFGFQSQAIGQDTCLQGLDLAGDRIGFGLLFRRNPGVDRRPRTFRASSTIPCG